MNHSMLTCGRTTHLKILAVALIAVALVTTVGLTTRLDKPATVETRARNSSSIL